MFDWVKRWARLLAIAYLAWLPLAYADALPIATVNIDEILKRSPQSAAESQRLESLYAEREKQLIAAQTQLTEAQRNFRLQVEETDETERVERESALRQQQREINRKMEDLREEVRIARDTALKSLQVQVAEAVEAVRAQEDIDIVFRESDFVTANANINITERVLAYLQAQFEMQTKTESQSESQN